MHSEFDFIQNIKNRYTLQHVGDDCAVMPMNQRSDLVITADMLVENIDFRLEWTSPEVLGHKSLAVSLSDVAAMGANPLWAMLSIAVPEPIWNDGFIDQFYEGWFTLARQYGIELIGGDVSRSPDGLVIDSIVGGRVAKGRAILRSGAKPGDAIYVSGKLGGAAGGLRLLENSDRNRGDVSELVLRQLKPQPQLSLANSLQKLNILTSMIDISDGLSSDLRHICKESEVGARIYANQLPIDDELHRHFPPQECLNLAVNGGEDFELLFTTSKKNQLLLDSLDVSYIGEILEEETVIEIINDNGSHALLAGGYSHF
jgi:thiamine-monophosphate kinase